MAINMGLTLCHLLFFVSAVYWVLSQEQDMSSENINEILDRLIQQTRPNESGIVPDIVDTVNPSVETPPVQGSQQSNISSIEVDEVTELTTGEETSPRTTKVITKSFIEIEHQKQTIPRQLYGGNTILKTENVDRNITSVEHLIKKEFISDSNTINNNKNSQQNYNLNLLHQYPEIIIDHVTYDNDEQTNDSKPVTPTVNTHHVQEIFPKPSLRMRHSNSDENIETANRGHSEHSGTNNYLTPEIKDLIDTIIQKKVTHDTLLRQGTESETRKQSKLLEKILQKLPEMKLVGNNGKDNYLRQREHVHPPEIDTLPRFGNPADSLVLRNVGNHFIKPYLHAPHVINKWEIHSRLLKTLLRTCRPNGLNHVRLIAELIDRIISNIDYRSACYDLFK
ncbi:unnamed protein product [Spodoptera littoralis]|uniref:Uncharacterized protein n=1 Tax=Spodoptera littoralis TaxID=7109 RepID=A0A9P0HXK6_SPOLI|nr:unnamed protein product [Spodoptera littoralis]CAH1635650.1 unnamed protein product [Spodoptera littoralis]